MGTAVDSTAPGANRIEDDPVIYQLLIDGFTKGYTDSEACLAAGVSKSTLFRYIALHPEFQELKEELKKNPILTAKTRVVSELPNDTQTAKWYLERKTKEFKPPNKDTNITLNQLNLLTESQIKDRLAHKLSKLLTDHNEPVDHNDLNVIDVDSNTVDSDDMDT